ncbi:hypothetical protein LCGC14_2288580 [marine sediment metagenome]|uniref:RNA polymerase sigma-70 domain-containing protein n=1 Tax=marine sediment metagenome TaxID=412755 RepID=A0A0F9DEH1_9ZZZZ
MASRIQAALDSLDAKDRRIIELRYGIGKEPALTLEECGKVLALSRDRIRQLEARGVRKLEEATHISWLGDMAAGTSVECSTITTQTLLTDTDFSFRTRNALQQGDMQTVGDVVKRSRKNLLTMRNLGEVAANEIDRKLAAWGLRPSTIYPGPSSQTSASAKQEIVIRLQITVEMAGQE